MIKLKQFLESWKNNHEVSITDISSYSNQLSAELPDNTEIIQRGIRTPDIEVNEIIVDNRIHNTEITQTDNETSDTGANEDVPNNNETELEILNSPQYDLNQEVSLTNEIFNSELNYYETEIQTSEVIEILTNNDVEMKTTNNSECESFTEMFNGEEISITKLSEIKIPITIKKGEGRKD